MSGESSKDTSRENSSTDIKGKEKRKNVHFHTHERSPTRHSVETGNSVIPSDLEEFSTSGTITRPSSVKSRPRASLRQQDSGTGLFFLAEDEDDATDVPITPFKKTGKIKASSKLPVSPNLRPQFASGVPASVNSMNPFTDETNKERLSERRQSGIDIPMIRLPSSTGLDSGTSHAHLPETPNVDETKMVTPVGNPGTPAENLNDTTTSSYANSVRSNDTYTDLSGQALLFNNTSKNSTNFQHDATDIPSSNMETSEEHRRMNLEAYKLVRAHTIRADVHAREDVAGRSAEGSRRSSFASTVGSERNAGLPDQMESMDPPEHLLKKHSTRGGVLSNLMQLYNSTVFQQPTNPRQGHSSGSTTPKWHQRHSQSNSSLVALLGAGQSIGSVAGMGLHSRNASTTSLADLDKPQRPNLSKMRKHSGGLVGAVKHSFQRPRFDAELRIAMAIADVLQRQKFIIKLCRALMLYGAPTHRLEDYLKLTSRALEIDAQFLYIPGCMIVAFDDKTTHTTDVKIVRVNQGIDLGKLNEIHTIYKNVLHLVVNVDQGIEELDRQMDSPQLYKLGFVLFAYGLAAVCVGPFAFGSSFIDLPIQFLLGLIVGILQLVVAPRSQLYANVFEILATICVSFLGRGFGSIPRPGGDGQVFCFAAVTQSAIALILPGYMVLCGALELQSKSIVAGSVRLFYAIVYSLFLSFGITIGSVLYGWMDTGATTATTCESDISDWYRFLFVPGFALCLLIVNQARPRQAPVALLIASAGYATNYFTLKKFGAAQVSNAIGAFVIGCLGNLYSRIGHGLAFTAVLPSIFVQVPSGLASGSSLISGLSLATSILNNTANSTYGSSTLSTSGTSALEFGYAMITIAIGITVGLFASALVIYVPIWGTGKRTGLLTF